MYADPDAEFSGKRSTNYQDALRIYPEAWRHDLKLMHDMLQPMPGESIVEIGAGTGYFSREIAGKVGSNGRLDIVDPAPEQTQGLTEILSRNVRIHHRRQKCLTWHSRVSMPSGAVALFIMSAIKPGRLSDSPRTPNPAGDW